jgi:cytochrome c peroxidase
VPLAVAVGNVRRNDLGRYAITRRPGDRWKFRTPSLRNAALTAPYMHDGSLSTLGAVLDYYARGGTPHAGQDERIKPFAMTPDSRTELIEFLRSLTSPSADALAREARRVAIGER